MQLTPCLASFVLLASCTHKPAPGESIADACRKDNDGREVRASGYLQAPILVGCEKKDCSLQLTSSRKENYGLEIRIPLGYGPSTMTPLKPSGRTSMPGTIGVEEVTVSIRDANGGSVSVRDVVRVTGKMSAYESSGELRCSVDVSRLERP
jgi:hypothetical protein